MNEGAMKAKYSKEPGREGRHYGGKEGVRKKMKGVGRKGRGRGRKEWVR